MALNESGLGTSCSLIGSRYKSPVPPLPLMGCGVVCRDGAIWSARAGCNRCPGCLKPTQAVNVLEFLSVFLVAWLRNCVDLLGLLGDHSSFSQVWAAHSRRSTLSWPLKLGCS